MEGSGYRGRGLVVVVLVAVLTVPACLATDHGFGDGSSPHGDETGLGCDSLYVIYAEEIGNAVGIYSASEKSPPHEITRLANHSLPTVGCGPDFLHCELRCFACRDEDTLCCAMPVVNPFGDNSLALLQLRQPSNDDPHFELDDSAVVEVQADCVAVRMFSRVSGLNLKNFVACINTTAISSQTYTWFLELLFDASNISATSKFDRFSVAHTLHLDGSLSLSELLQVHVESSRSGCESSENVFFIANGVVFTLRLSSQGFAFTRGSTIAECLYPTDLGYLERNELLLRVQCSDYITKIYAPCSSEEVVETYDSRINGTIYQCTGEDIRLDLTLQEDLLNITSYSDLGNLLPSQPFPFTENVSHAFCEAGDDFAFVFTLRNGSIFSLSLTTGRLSVLTHNSCNSSSRDQCYRAHKTGIDSIVTAYDHQDSSFVLANISCPVEPVVARIPIYPKPPLAAYVTGSGADSCQCSDSGGGRTSSSLEHPFSSTVSDHGVTVSPTSVSVLVTTNTVSQRVSSTEIHASPTQTLNPDTEEKRQLEVPTNVIIIGASVAGVVLVLTLSIIIILCRGILWIRQRKHRTGGVRLDEHQGTNILTEFHTSSGASNGCSFEMSKSNEDHVPNSSPSTTQASSFSATTAIESSHDTMMQQSSLKEPDSSSTSQLESDPSLPSSTSTSQSREGNSVTQATTSCAEATPRTPPPKSKLNGKALLHALTVSLPDTTPEEQPSTPPPQSSVEPTPSPSAASTATPATTQVAIGATTENLTVPLPEEGSNNGSLYVNSNICSPPITNSHLTGASVNHLTEANSDHGETVIATPESGNTINDTPVTGVGTPLPTSNQRQQQQQQQQQQNQRQQQQQNHQQQQQQQQRQHQQSPDPSTGQGT